MAMRLSPHMMVMQNAAQKAARGLLRDFNEVEMLQVSVKGPGDFVSQADLRAESTIRTELEKARPGYAFLMEESGYSGSDNWSWRWIVDPLDGTTNFLHGIPHWAISIALQKRNDNGDIEIVSGLVYNPVANEMFWAEKGIGAFLNERRLRVSARRDMYQAVFATGIPFAISTEEKRKGFVQTVSSLMPQIAGLRRFGAAALDLAWVAAGRYEGFWELGLKPWDVAAGLILVREAGGHVSDIQGNPLNDIGMSVDTVAANAALFSTIREIISDNTPNK
ncbi:6-bisphosphatase or related enzyme [Commensalibacter communis]|uniref:Inositol-1-monophosphatase n=2 Tax=Commensalibacter communis TaxID=2972786 RepID=A0A9W4TML3_9PROT|nr:6-bisphosphatase or related enzyme [Commensalibacter communis]CAI3924285.1 6-bisphosphatase or related enzyme [Commensalibacter communis]CAI3929099.1 6-bisphosphatase or related enzyme [Commensalibacter communis]CAI3930407.1 6-bisphosphatase or related enzyme [Commensalibacter communis]CAI3930581.1 6-bisphosphatase or related enzyme [Commensalibacter communis]